MIGLNPMAPSWFCHGGFELSVVRTPADQISFPKEMIFYIPEAPGGAAGKVRAPLHVGGRLPAGQQSVFRKALRYFQAFRNLIHILG